MFQERVSAILGLIIWPLHKRGMKIICCFSIMTLRSLSLGWLSQMVGWQKLPGVGSVGALLYFPNERIQHAGITHKLLYNILPAPSLKWVHRDEPSYQDYARLTRDSAAQTAACLLTPRVIFNEYGGFDEKHFNIAYNDCDYGFRLAQSGLRNVYCPAAELYHHEGLTRGTGRGTIAPVKNPPLSRNMPVGMIPFIALILPLDGLILPYSLAHPLRRRWLDCGWPLPHTILISRALR